MKTRMKLWYAACTAMALCFLLLSCAEDGFSDSRRSNDAQKIAFAVTMEESPSNGTRAVAGAESFLVDSFDIEGQTAYLICDVTDMSAADYGKPLATRGTPIYNSTSAAVEGGAKIFGLGTEYGEFKVSAYLNGKVTTPLRENYLDAGGVRVTDGDPFEGIAFHYNANQEANNGSRIEYWQPQIGDDQYYWLNNDKLTFYAYAPTDYASSKLNWAGPGTGAYKDNGEMEFTYTVPVGTSTPRKDAELQPDILISTTGKTAIEKPSEKTIKLDGVQTSDKFYVVPMTFFHPLAGVRFAVNEPTEADDDIMTGYTIESITLSNLCPTAKCTFAYPSGKTPANASSADVISWSNHATANATYTQTFNHKIVDGTTSGELAYDSGKEYQTFMLLPQTLGETGTNAPNSQVSIVLRDKAGVKLIVKPQKLKGSKGASGTAPSAWKPGKMYTYRIATAWKEVKVSVSDSMDKTTMKKNNLAIKNTGEAISFIRVSVTGDWFDDTTGRLIPYDATTWATDMAACNATSWYKGADGFYYYRYPLLAGKTITGTNNLFSTVTFTQDPPYTGCHLEVNILVQAIRTSDVEEAWGTGIITTAGLQTEPSSIDI